MLKEMLSRKFYGAFSKFPEQTDCREPSRAQAEQDSGCVLACVAPCSPCHGPSALSTLAFWALFIVGRFIKELISLN